MNKNLIVNNNVIANYGKIQRLDLEGQTKFSMVFLGLIQRVVASKSKDNRFRNKKKL